VEVQENSKVVFIRMISTCKDGCSRKWCIVMGVQEGCTRS